MAAANANRGISGFLRKSWNETPEIFGSAIMGGIGIVMGIVACKHYYDNDGDNRKYRANYVVLRHDDPKVSRLKTQCDTTGL